MKIVYKGMTLWVVKDYAALSQKAANIVSAQVNLKSDSVLGLATGTTPEGMYAALVKMYEQHAVDFGEVTSFNLDEYYQLSEDNDQSYAYYMKRHFFDHVNIPEGHTYLPDGMAKDVAGSCARYDHMLEEIGNLDLQILGIGNNGHIGFNEPDIKFETGTHLVTLDEGTVEANARFFDSIDQVPKKAISMGIRNIMHARKIVLMASGAGKSNAIKEMILGPVTPTLPASVLQLHNDVTMIIDEAAASGLLEAFESNGVVA